MMSHKSRSVRSRSCSSLPPNATPQTPKGRNSTSGSNRQPSLIDQCKAKYAARIQESNQLSASQSLSHFFTPKRSSSLKATSTIRTMTAMGVFSQVHKCENNWREKVNQFAAKTEEKDKFQKDLQKQGDFLKLNKEERKSRIKKLFKDSYRRHHPRRVILDFFNDVAREGAHDVEEKGKIETYECLHPMLRYFNRASVFTVWRPTSMDAMIRMIRCEAVGKGLDIKAKSAIRGEHSGYVPFLQIRGNSEKRRIKDFPKDGTVKLFFKQEEKEEAEMVRAKAIATLELVAHEILEMKDVEKLSHALSLAKDEETQARLLEELNEMNTKSMDLQGYSITLIDEYAPRTYGLEIPMLLFWETFVVRQDITCEKGSTYDMGRQSCPRNQNLNISASVYKKGQNINNKGDDRVVILQTAGLESPMNPFGLLMAYEMEEKKEVLPVVSDCDCFLVGTRRVTYQSPLDPEQLEVMKWCVSEMSKILETPTSKDCTWAEEWGNVLERASSEGFKPKIPKIGFGDPKSCSIMENAVNRLIGEGSGGVRHGAECFNYHFPQELEDEYIIIADCLPGDQPWMRVNLAELHDFLDEKISCSYTFPLNPKWILCDGGRWRDHYDKMMASDNENTRESMNIWFPQDSGIREQIEDMREDYPNGYCPGMSSVRRSRRISEEVCFNSSIMLASPSGNRGFWSPQKKSRLSQLPTIDSAPSTPCSAEQEKAKIPSLLMMSDNESSDESPESLNPTSPRGIVGLFPPFHPEMEEAIEDTSSNSSSSSREFRAEAQRTKKTTQSAGKKTEPADISRTPQRKLRAKAQSTNTIHSGSNLRTRKRESKVETLKATLESEVAATSSRGCGRTETPKARRKSEASADSSPLFRQWARTDTSIVTKEKSSPTPGSEGEERSSNAKGTTNEGSKSLSPQPQERQSTTRTKQLSPRMTRSAQLRMETTQRKNRNNAAFIV